MELTNYAIPAYVLLILIELISYRFIPDEEEQGYTVRDTATSLSMGLGYVAINAGWGIVYLAAFEGVQHLTPLHIGTSWPAAIGVFVGWDFFYYWEHRADHRVRLLWASHINHHSSTRFNFSTALRQPWTGFGNLPFALPLVLIGFSPAAIFTAQSVNLLYQFWIHTERIDKLWKPIELVMNTPSHHRVHHGSNRRYLDRNYAGVFIVWDRLFKTFTPESERVVYGLTKNIDTYNPLRVAFHEYAAIGRDLRAVSTFKDRYTVLFGTPSKAYRAASRASAGVGVSASAGAGA